MKGSGRARSRLLASLVTAGLALLAVGLPSQAQAFLPDIVFGSVTHSKISGEAIFSVKVSMGKGNDRSQESVDITFEGTTYGAARTENVRTYWETNSVAAPRRACYRVLVRAGNEDGSAEKRLRLGRRGSDGCG